VTRLVVGGLAFVAGALLWFLSRARARPLAPGAAPVPVATLPRVGLALAALGLATLASTQPGVAWSVSSICFSLVAIVLIVTVLRDSLRR
jgi:hypothetical protein